MTCTRKSIILAVCLGLAPWQALADQGGCYADYRASKRKPFGLHYGVIEVSQTPCETTQDLATEIRDRLKAAGWTLEDVIGTFGPEGLAERKDDAKAYYLKC